MTALLTRGVTPFPEGMDTLIDQLDKLNTAFTGASELYVSVSPVHNSQDWQLSFTEQHPTPVADWIKETFAASVSTPTPSSDPYNTAPKTTHAWTVDPAKIADITQQVMSARLDY